MRNLIDVNKKPICVLSIINKNKINYKGDFKMARFKPMTEVQNSQTNITLGKATAAGTKYPFKN